MIMFLSFFRLYADEEINFAKVEMLKAHFRKVNSNLVIHKWYDLYRDSADYWKNWDGKSIIVRLKRGKSLPPALRNFNVIPLKYSPSYLVELTGYAKNPDFVKNLLNELNSDPNVEFAEPNLIYRALYWPNDPYMGTSLWGLWVIYADKAWDITVGSRSIKVCVIDQGVDYNHEDLAANYGYGKDFVDNDNDPYPVSSLEFHGTHVAGTISAVMDNGRGVVGVSQSLILSCRALNDSGVGSSVWVSQCVRWCADTGAKVINMSLGSYSPSSELESAVNYAVDTAGVVVVAAAGNDGSSSVNYPAAYDACIAVGAIDTSGQRAYFSNYGQELDVVAPGVMILSTMPFISSYSYLDGTSMATPHVSGLAALILSKNPNLSPADVRGIITGTAIDMGEMGKDWFYGYGLINSYRALLATPSPTFVGDIRIVKGKRKVLVEGLSNVDIFDIRGRRVFSGKRFEGYLPRGVYFVKGLKETHKFVITW